MIKSTVGKAFISEFATSNENVIQDIIGIPFDRVKSINDLKIDNEIDIKKSIIDNPKLSYEDRITLNAVLNRSLKTFYRKVQVLGIALDEMDEDANMDNLDKDWLLDFFDKVSKIEEADSQKVFGMLLAKAASDEELCSKTLLNCLFLMGKKEVRSFLNICRFTFVEMDVDDENQIVAVPVIYFSQNVKKFNKHGLSSHMLNKLQTLGLIEVDFKSEYVFRSEHVRLRYGNSVVEIENGKSTRIGNVRFTYDGFLLYQITEKMHNPAILNGIIHTWFKRKYTIYLNNSKI